MTIFSGETMKKIDFSKFYPKQRSGKECKKVNCIRYESYIRWQCGDTNLTFCMECKNAHISQYKTHNIGVKL